MEWIVFGALVGICALLDIRTRKLPFWLLIIGLISMSVILLLQGKLAEWERLSGAMIGIVLFGVSRLSNGGIGSGDCYIFTLSGLVLGFFSNFCLLFWSIIIAGFVSILLLCLKKVNRKSELPFIPFVFVSYLFVVLL